MGKVDGSNILYHYLQKDMRKSEFPLYLQMVMKLVTDLGIWIHPDDYKRLPISVPYAVRDPMLTTKVRAPWGTPQIETGLMRDDNSIIKAIVKGKKKTMSSSVVSRYNGGYLGNNFVASHVWREIGTEERLSNRDHRLFSFIPNLVWLPKEVSKFTDREGSIIQSMIQQISMKIYRKIPVSESMSRFTEESWGILEDAGNMSPIPAESLPDTSKLTFIRITDSYIKNRTGKIGKLAESLLQHANNSEIEPPNISKKYDPFIHTIDRKAARKLGEWLSDYHSAILDSSPS